MFLNEWDETAKDAKVAKKTQSGQYFLGLLECLAVQFEWCN
jgi:hypothetical protein